MLIGSALGGALLAWGCATDPCDDLQSALDGGGTVELSGCEVEGAFVVPPGTTLEALDARLRGPSNAAALELSPGSRVTGLVIEAGPGASSVGVTVASGAQLTAVTVEASAGLGVVVTGHARLERVTVRGPVTAEAAPEVSVPPDRAETPTVGLLVREAGTRADPVELRDVEVSGFARFGVLAENSEVVWHGGGTDGTLGVGAMFSGGAATLRDVRACNTFQGLQPIPAYGVVFSNGARAETQSVTLCDNEGYGMLQDGAEVTHEDLGSFRNGEAGVWAQNGAAIEIFGDGSSLMENRLAGVVLVNTEEASVRDATIEATTLAVRIDRNLGELRVGDGVHVVLPEATSLTLSDLALRMNERTGLLIDVATGAIDAARIQNIEVEGTGDGLGAIAQTPTGPLVNGWDANITRVGAPSVNDSRVTQRLDTVGIIEPMFLPRN